MQLQWCDDLHMPQNELNSISFPCYREYFELDMQTDIEIFSTYIFWRLCGRFRKGGLQWMCAFRVKRCWSILCLKRIDRHEPRRSQPMVPCNFDQLKSMGRSNVYIQTFLFKSRQQAQVNDVYYCVWVFLFLAFCLVAFMLSLSFHYRCCYAVYCFHFIFLQRCDIPSILAIEYFGTQYLFTISAVFPAISLCLTLSFLRCHPQFSFDVIYACHFSWLLAELWSFRLK